MQTSLERSQQGYSDYADEALIHAHQRQEQINHMLIKERISPLHVQKLQASILKQKSYYRPSKKSNFLSIKEEITKKPSPMDSSQGLPSQSSQPLHGQQKPAYSPISTKYGEFKQKNKRERSQLLLVLNTFSITDKLNY